ncbi:MAG: DEAD/DEAH box helicase family protein [Candidatus Methanoperedens sp.]|nr:DEAD/DEAH box helicase family protein [Candidatus Methanoperedens sp.]
MNEAETRAELIDPKLKESGWGVIEGSKILREYHITIGKLQTGAGRAKPLISDYILVYKGRKLAQIEAKSDEQEVGEGVAQAKNYAEKLHLQTTFSTNGKEIYQICMETGKEGLITNFPTPDELWNKTYKIQNNWKEKFNAIPNGGIYEPRFYQEIATNKALEAIAEQKNRLLLTLATGTGKTTIGFQISWKLFHARWNLKRDGARRPRILFLADRNILANQAFNEFSAFPEDALVRIKPDEIRKKGSVPTNGSIFFTIFQTFMSGPNDTPYFGEYPKDFFDLIIIDECHRGGANDEGNWRAIMEYFSPAVQLGLTATPKREENADTYKYFGEPLYVYSLKEGINDGFLTPFKVRRIKTTMDEYVYVSDDEIIEGEVEEGKIYTGADWNKIIEIKAREAYNVKLLLKEINQNEKAIIFCATQDHALAIRDLINQNKKSTEPNYCARVTANDGKLGEQYLAEFRDNEKTIPTILTTSQKLSTGVDARNIRNIILMRPINSMIEFKQIVGRGTRLFEGKEFFTIYDFVGAYHHFSDPEWDGEPLEPEPSTKSKPMKLKETSAPYGAGNDDEPKKKKLKIKLGDGKEREIQHTMQTSFWSADGKPISAEEFLHSLFGKLPEFFKDEDELRKIWSNPITRKALLDKLAEAGYGMNELKTLQQLINAQNCDIFDALEYISYAIKPISREERVARAQLNIFKSLDNNQKEFLEFVLSKYVETGIEELGQEKLPDLLKIKYSAINDATELLGGVNRIRATFFNFQQHLFATA